jgi:hypothetical protein
MGVRNCNLFQEQKKKETRVQLLVRAFPGVLLAQEHMQHGEHMVRSRTYGRMLKRCGGVSKSEEMWWQETIEYKSIVSIYIKKHEEKKTYTIVCSPT